MAEPKQKPAAVDPWEEEAKNFKPSPQSTAAPAESGDDWKVWQMGNTDGDAGGGGNALQRSFDENTKTNPKEPLLKTGLKSVVGGAGGMFVHPWETVKSVGSGLVHSLNPSDPESPIAKMASGAKEDYQAGGLPYALTKTAGNLFGNVAGGAA